MQSGIPARTILSEGFRSLDTVGPKLALHATNRCMRMPASCPIAKSSLPSIHGYIISIDHQSSYQERAVRVLKITVAEFRGSCNDDIFYTELVITGREEAEYIQLKGLVGQIPPHLASLSLPHSRTRLPIRVTTQSDETS